LEKVIVYTRDGCQPCRITKNKLTENGIEFEEINCSEHPEAIETLKLYGYQSFPVVSVGNLDNSWSGLQPDRIKELTE